MQELSPHARTRMQQRSIDPEMIEVALRYGRMRHDHGSEVYELGDRSLVGTPYERERERLRGLSVVMSRDGSVTTVKWAYHLRHRPGIGSRSRLRERGVQAFSRRSASSRANISSFES